MAKDSEALVKDWLEAADQALSFIEDVSHRSQVLDRFEAQYLRALLAASTPAEVWRAWEAFHYYLTVRPTRRKPFALSSGEADRVIAALTELLDLPPHSA